MPVALVSCAGPDDGVDAAEVAAIAALPLAEVAIQLSATREGEPRYPTHGWINLLASLLQASRASGAAPRAALHLNGRWCRAACRGEMPERVARLLALGDGAGQAFTRLQLNFDASRDGIDADALAAALPGIGARVVLQAKPGNMGLLAELAASGADFDVLHDASCGLGIRPSAWPAAFPGRFNAWAGGITPEGAAADIAAIAAVADAPFGIDAESGLRTPGTRARFEPARARSLVMAAHGWNASAAAGRAGRTARKENFPISH